MIYRTIASACVVLLVTGCAIAEETEGRAVADNVGSVAEALIGRYNLSGGWKLGNTPISVEQNGDNLRFFWPGHITEARFSDPDTIVAAFGGDCCTGIVSNGGQVIKWSNGAIWIRD